MDKYINKISIEDSREWDITKDASNKKHSYKIKSIKWKGHVMHYRLNSIGTFLIVILILVSIIITGVSNLAIADPYEGEIIITESCDTFDTTKWRFVWNPPIVKDGTWVYDFPAYQSKNIAAQLKVLSGYGIYRIRFKTNGARVPGVNYSPFLINGDNPNSNQELDMLEIYGANKPPHSPPYQMSFSSFNGERSNYEFWTNPFDWEDGNYHIFECIYTAEQITIKMDGVISHIIYEGQRYGKPCDPWFAQPPMYFQMYAGSNGNNPSRFQLIIDYIEIISLPSQDCPDWDINMDGTCNALDLALISFNYGKVGSPRWIREDVDGNGKIDMLDLIAVSVHYGKTWKIS